MQLHMKTIVELILICYFKYSYCTVLIMNIHDSCGYHILPSNPLYICDHRVTIGMTSHYNIVYNLVDT